MPEPGIFLKRWNCAEEFASSDCRHLGLEPVPLHRGPRSDLAFAFATIVIEKKYMTIMRIMGSADVSVAAESSELRCGAWLQLASLCRCSMPFGWI